MKLIRIFLLWLLFISIFNNKILAQDDNYIISDKNSSFSMEFLEIDEAIEYYDSHIDEYDNLVLRNNDEVLLMEYGIVEFKRDSACSINIDYYSNTKQSNDYINGCYGIDGAYLKSSKDLQDIYFMLGSEIGYTDKDNVILHPFEELETRISSYTIKDNKLIHNIMTQLQYDYYSFSIELDDKIDYLDSDKEYYSYDNHYFYDDFYKMIDDYKNDTRENALNSIPYFNYYQYLPHRSITNYNHQEIEDFLYNTLAIDHKLSHYNDLNNDQAADEINRSQLYDEVDSFFSNQYIYGTNALMLISSAINESSYGRSYNAYNSNNLYYVSAYESQSEKDFNKYNNVSDSIYARSKYVISSLYSNYLKANYSGTFFGNKISGLNYSYSSDPYYGEKAASAYYDLDSKLGKKDYNNYALAIVLDRSKLNLYKDEDLDNLLQSLEDIKELSFVILEEHQNAYKIQIDYSFNDDYRYDFDRSIAYIPKERVDFVINEDKIHGYDFIEQEYDFDGGRYHDYSSLNLKLLDDSYSGLRPIKEGYEFIGFENNVAKYKEIKDIQLVKDFNTKVPLNRNIDLSDGVLKVIYEDSSKEIPLTSDMIFNLDSSQEGIQDIEIRYNGKTITKQIEVLNYNNQLMDDAIDNMDLDYIKKNLENSNYPFTFSQIRNIDYELMKTNNRNYVISDETERYNLSISGLDLSLKDRHVLHFFTDTYYVIVKDIDIEDRNKIYNLAKGYGFSDVEGIDISFRFNYEDIKLIGPAIIQIDLKDKQNDLVYSVYHLSENGDIIKCRTTQSENYVQFMIHEDGPYLVLSMPSVNEYDIADNIEDLSYENMGFDNHRINFSLMAAVVLSLLGIIGILLYYIIANKRKKLWKDFRKLLHTVAYAQEEKQNN